MTMNTHLANAPSAELCEVARRGNQAAYAELVLRFSPQMRASLRSTIARSRHWGRDRPEDVSDLLQELMLLLLTQGPAFLGSGEGGGEVPTEARFRTAASRLARSYMRNGRRSAWAELPSTGDIDLLAGPERTEDVLAARDSLRRTFAGVGVGTARAIVHALYVEGRDLDEICRAWQISRNSVYCATRRFRAHARTLAESQRTY
jgi:DNA-directed RNA polymerase specialized sigma24 family protein